MYKTTKTTFAVGYVNRGELVPIMLFDTMEMCVVVMRSQIFRKDWVRCTVGSIDYNKTDCEILWKAIAQFEEEIVGLGGQLQQTIASTSSQ